ncbi:MAG: ArnT family glycosyltransferase [Bdellovibrionia bacterium]
MNLENQSNSTTNKLLLLLFGLVLVVKLVLAYFVPLGFDEAYYWVWSHHLQLSYFDHPAMISWLLRLGHLFEDWGYLVRMPIVLIGHLTLLVWWFILREAGLSLASKKLFYLLALSLPFLGVGSIVATPDVPVVFFWSLSTLLFIQYWKKPTLGVSIAFGAALGLGFCSKYHIVLFPVFALLAVLHQKKWELLKPKFLLTIIISGLIFSVPVLLWNYQNDFASFKFQLNHGFVKKSWSPLWIIEYFVSQILLVGPVVIYLAINKLNKNLVVHAFLGFGTLIFFAIANFKAPGEANWPVIGYFSLLALAVSTGLKQKALRMQAILYMGISSLAVALMFIPQTQKNLGKLSEPQEFRQYAQELKNYEPLYCSKYQLCSVLWFELKRPIYKIPEISRRDFFDTLTTKESFPDFFYVVVDTGREFPPWFLETFTSINKIKILGQDLELYEVKR